jgi:type I restriction enzyme, S subunit
MSEWKEVKIEQLCEAIIDCVNKTAPIVEEVTPYRMIRTTNVKDGRIDLSSTNYVTEDIFRKWTRRSMLKKGDIILTREAPLGEVGKIIDGENLFLGQRLMMYRPDPDIVDPEFLFYAFLSKEVQYQIKSFGMGSTVEHMRVGDCSEIIIKAPGLEEQHEIGKTLSHLDRKIENLRKQNETLERIAQTLFKHWFVDFEFPNDEGKPYKSSGGEMMRSELGEIPVSWRVGTLGDEVETLGGGTPSTTISEYWENGDIFWYSPTDLTKAKTLFSLGSEKKITKLGLEKSSAKLFPKYSLLLTSRATIGEITINTQDASTNQGFITIIPNQKYSVYFLYGWLLTQIILIKSLASGSTFPELSKSTFRDFPFLKSDSEILTKYNQSVKPIFQKIEANIKQIQTLTKTRDVLLPKLMSGQLRITKEGS